MEVRSNCYQDDVTLWIELGGRQLCCHVDDVPISFALRSKSER